MDDARFNARLYNERNGKTETIITVPNLWFVARLTESTLFWRNVELNKM